MRLLSVGAVLALLAFAAATAWLFLAPPTDRPTDADAVVVLGPGPEGERFREAMRLMHADVAPVLVVSEGHSGHRTVEQSLCAHADRRFEVICFQAEPFSTRGEARTVSALAHARDWQSLVVVTSTYHVTRARILFGRCFGDRLQVVDARPSAGAVRLLRAVVHEWGGLIYAFVVARGC